jgi:hypothetical protein
MKQTADAGMKRGGNDVTSPLNGEREICGAALFIHTAA